MATAGCLPRSPFARSAPPWPLRGRPQPSERIPAGVRAYLAGEIAAAGGARCRSSPRWTATASSPGPGPSPGAPWTWCSRCRAWRSGARCCCTTTRAAGSIPRHPTSTSRPACTTAGWASASSTTAPRRSTSSWRCRTTAPVLRIDPFDVVDTLGEGGPVARAAGAVRGPAEPARHGRLHRRRVQRRRRAAARGGDRASGSRSPIWCPRSHWARANGERTVVSTNTINLQEQLVGKDLPLLRRALGGDDYTPTFALLKGWRNYLCLARLHQAVGARSARCSSRTSSTS